MTDKAAQINLLNDLVRSLSNEGSFHEAVGIARQVLALVLEHHGSPHADSLAALGTLAALHRRAGESSEAEARYRDLLDAQRSLLGGTHPDVADTLQQLATLRESEGDAASAAAFYKEAIELTVARLGREHADTTLLMNALGELYRRNGDHEAACSVHAEALVLRRKTNGDSSLDVAHSLNNLGIAQFDAGRPADAEAHYTEAIAIKRRLIGSDHYSYGITLNNLATLYIKTNRRAQAVPLLLEVIAVWRHCPEAADVGLMKVIQTLAESYVRMERHADAIPLYEELLEHQRRKLGDSHSDVLILFNNLGMMYYLTERYAEAEPHLRRSAELLRSAADPMLAPALKNLAAVYRKLDDDTSAATVYRELLSIQHATLPPDDPDIARTQQKLADVTGEAPAQDPEQAAPATDAASQIGALHRQIARYYKDDEYAKATTACEKLLEIVLQQKGDNHPDTATVRENLSTLRDAWGDQLGNVATAFYRSGKLKQALPLCQQVCDLKRLAFGEDHPEYATSLNNLGELRRAMQDRPEAERLHRLALAIRKSALGDTHEDVAQSCNNLALSLDDARADEAESLYQQALEAKRHTIGDRDPGYATSLNNLAGLFMRTGRDRDAAPLLRQAIDIWRETDQGEALHCTRAVESLAAIDETLGNLRDAAAGFRDLLNLARDRGEPDLLPYLGRLAAIELQSGNFAAAEPLYREMVAVARTKYGKRGPQLAVHLNNLATVCYAQDKDEAEPLFVEAIKLWRRQSSEYRALIMALNSLAAHYQKRGDFAAAASRYKEALALRQEELGPDHPDVATSFNNLARVHRESGKYKAALSFAEKALKIRRSALDAHDPAIAETLNLQALACQGLGDHATAEQHFRGALVIRAAGAASDPSSYGTALFNLATGLKTQGKLADAETFFRQAGDLWKSSRGTDDPSYALSQQHLAGLYHEQGRYAEAEALYLETTATLERALGTQNPSVARGTKALGALYSETGKFAAAESLLRRSIETLRAAPGPRAALADSLDSLAACQFEQGRYTDGLALVREGRDIRIEALGPEHPDVANSQFLLGAFHQKMGLYPDAEASFQRSLEIRMRAAGSPAEVAEVLNALGVLYHETARFAEAESSIRKAMQTTRRHYSDTHVQFAVCLANLADLHRAMGDYRSAERHYHQAFRIWRERLGPKHPLFATGLSNLGKLFIETGNYEAAKPLLDQALDVRRAVFDARHPLIAASLKRRASLAIAMGDEREAESWLDEALTIYRSVLGPEHADVGECLHDLAVLHNRTGRRDSSELLHREALAIQTRVFGREHPDVAASHFALAVLFAREGRAAEALALFKDAEAIEDGVIQQIFSIGSEKQRLQYLETRAGRLDGLLSLVFTSFPDDAAARQIALDLVLRRKGLVGESAAVTRQFAASDRHPALKPRLDRWAALTMQIARKTLAGPGTDGVDDHHRQIAEWTREKDELEADLAREIPEIQLTEALKRTSGRAVAAKLGDGQVLIEFVRYHVFDFNASGRDDWKPPRYCAFVLTKEGPDVPGLVDLGEATRLESLIAAFRDMITSEDEPATSSPHTDGSDLRRAIFDPLVSHLGNATRIVLATDGELSLLPFEILPLDDGSRVIDRYALSYLGTGRDMLHRRPHAAGTAPLVVADPDFDLGMGGPRLRAVARRSANRPSPVASLQFDRLDETRPEGESIAGMLGVEPRIGGAALESLVKATRSPRVLHLATHGFFLPGTSKTPGAIEALAGGYDPDRPEPPPGDDPMLRSGLALAGANGASKGFTPPEAAEDGILTAADVCGLDLRNTDLVVLSACQTGLGDIHAGEGVIGLRRAFMLAGASTLVATLWKVPDTTTRTLMVAFYTRLLDGVPVAAALREAQLELKRSEPDPFCWGAFVCHGNAAASLAS